MELKYEELLSLVNNVLDQADKEDVEIYSILDLIDYLEENPIKVVEKPENN